MSGAVCTLFGAVAGTLFFMQHDGIVRVTGHISGLTPGKHGFHIHQDGDLREGCAKAMGHFNPTHKTHGAPYDFNRHVGDLGNIVANNNGVAQVDITDRVITLCGQKSIVGRSLVVHAGEDDLGRGGNEESLSTGNAGSRVACCVIGIVEFDHFLSD